MKKGAYDLGRKAIYYIVVIIIIAVLFIYISNSFRKYQVTRISYIDEVTDLVMINNIIKCVSQKDPDTGRIQLYKIDENLLKKDSLTGCLGEGSPYSDKAIKLEIKLKDTIEVETQKPYFEYNKYEKMVEYEGKEKKLKISIEKYPRVK